MNKKLLSVILSATILAGSMVGCGKKTESSDAKNMTVGTWKTAQTIQPFFYDEFSDESENLEVKPFTNPGDMKTALLSGDLDFTGTTWVTAIMAASKGLRVHLSMSLEKLTRIG